MTRGRGFESDSALKALWRHEVTVAIFDRNEDFEIETDLEFLPNQF